MLFVYHQSVVLLCDPALISGCVASMPSVSLADVSAGVFRFIGSRSDSDRTDVASGDPDRSLARSISREYAVHAWPLGSLVGPYCA